MALEGIGSAISDLQGILSSLGIGGGMGAVPYMFPSEMDPDIVYGLPPYWQPTATSMEGNCDQQGNLISASFPVLEIIPFKLSFDDKAKGVNSQYKKQYVKSNSIKFAVQADDVVSYTHTNEYAPSEFEKNSKSAIEIDMIREMHQMEKVYSGDEGAGVSQFLRDTATGLVDAMNNVGEGVTGNLSKGSLKQIAGSVAGIAGSATKALISGGRIDLPNIWQDSNTALNWQFRIKLRTMSSDPNSRLYKREIMDPLQILMALALPRSGGALAYLDPCYIEAKLGNILYTGMAGITNFTWSVPLNELNFNGVARAVEITIALSDLYNVMVQTEHGGAAEESGLPNSKKYLENIVKEKTWNYLPDRDKHAGNWYADPSVMKYVPLGSLLSDDSGPTTSEIVGPGVSAEDPKPSITPQPEKETEVVEEIKELLKENKSIEEIVEVLRGFQGDINQVNAALQYSNLAFIKIPQTNSAGEVLAYNYKVTFTIDIYGASADDETNVIDLPNDRKNINVEFSGSPTFLKLPNLINITTNLPIKFSSLKANQKYKYEFDVSKLKKFEIKSLPVFSSTSPRSVQVKSFSDLNFTREKCEDGVVRNKIKFHQTSTNNFKKLDVSKATKVRVSGTKKNNGDYSILSYEDTYKTIVLDSGKIFEEEYNSSSVINMIESTENIYKLDVSFSSRFATIFNKNAKNYFSNVDYNKVGNGMLINMPKTIMNNFIDELSPTLGYSIENYIMQDEDKENLDSYFLIMYYAVMSMSEFVKPILNDSDISLQQIKTATMNLISENVAWLDMRIRITQILSNTLERICQDIVNVLNRTNIREDIKYIYDINKINFLPYNKNEFFEDMMVMFQILAFLSRGSILETSCSFSPANELILMLEE